MGESSAKNSKIYRKLYYRRKRGTAECGGRGFIFSVVVVA